MFRSRVFNEKRDPFGRIDQEKDNEFFAIRLAPFEQSEQKLTSLDDNVGRNQINSRRDVAKIETLMARENQFDISQTDGPTGIFSAPLESAIKNFQEIKGLKKDGLITPQGETIGSLARLNSSQSDNGNEDNVPTPDKKPKPPEPKEPESDKDKPPIPPKKPEPDKDCSSLEAALAAAEAVQEEKSAAVASAKASAESLENKLVDIENKIDVQSADLDKVKVGVRGVAVGGGVIGGGLVGTTFGKSIPAGIAGAAAGGKTGLDFAGAALQGLEAQIVALKQQRDSIFAELAPIRARIGGLQAEASEIESNVSQVRDALKACRNKE